MAAASKIVERVWWRLQRQAGLIICWRYKVVEMEAARLRDSKL